MARRFAKVSEEEIVAINENVSLKMKCAKVCKILGPCIF